MVTVKKMQGSVIIAMNYFSCNVFIIIIVLYYWRLEKVPNQHRAPTFYVSPSFCAVMYTNFMNVCYVIFI